MMFVTALLEMMAISSYILAMYYHKSNMGYAHPDHWYIVKPSGSFESTHLIHY